MTLSNPFHSVKRLLIKNYTLLYHNKKSRDNSNQFFEVECRSIINVWRIKFCSKYCVYYEIQCIRLIFHSAVSYTICKLDTITSWAVDQSTIQFWTIWSKGHKHQNSTSWTVWKSLGLPLTKTVYCLQLYSHYNLKNVCKW